jgi:hypothetical protein
MSYQKRVAVYSVTPIFDCNDLAVDNNIQQNNAKEDKL